MAEMKRKAKRPTPATELAWRKRFEEQRRVTDELVAKLAELITELSNELRTIQLNRIEWSRKLDATVASRLGVLEHQLTRIESRWLNRIDVDRG